MIRCPLTVPLSAFAIFSNSNTIFKSTFVGQDVCFFVARGSLSHFQKKTRVSTRKLQEWMVGRLGRRLISFWGFGLFSRVIIASFKGYICAKTNPSWWFQPI